MAQAVAKPNIMEALEGAPFPASVSRLVSFAEGNHAARETIDLLRKLPDHVYENPSEVNHALGRVEEEEASAEFPRVPPEETIQEDYTL